MGLNLLDRSPEDAFALLPPGTGNYWSDNARIDPSTTDSARPQPAAQTIRDAELRAPTQVLHFGGVAFKYQQQPIDPAATTGAATRYMDVVTTSGEGTGKAAGIHKLRTMRAALGDHPLGIASGITPDNVARYLPYVDAFLVATGISKTFTELDPAATQDLCDGVRNWSAAA